MQPDSFRSHRRSAAALAIALGVLASTADSLMAQSGKNSGKGGKAETPQPLYAASLFSHPENGHMFSTIRPLINHQFQVTGGYFLRREDGTSYSGVFFYDPATHGNQAIDLNGVAQGLPEGFTIDRVWGMNDQGMIAVTIRPLDNIHPTLVQPYDPGFLQLPGLVDTADAYQFRALPDVGSNRLFPTAINNANDVVLVDYSGLPDIRATYIASFDAAQSDWQIVAELPQMTGTGISDWHGNDLFVVGGALDETGSSVTTRINLGTPGSGETTLPPVQFDKDTTYTFESPTFGGVNSWCDFVASLKATTVTTRRGQTTTTTVRTTYLFADTWEAYSFSDPFALNDNLDFLAGGVSDKPSLLVLRDGAEPIDLASVIDVSTAPEIEWDNPDLRLSCFDLTNRVVSDDGDPTNDLPVIVGIEHYRLASIYALDARHAFILTPILGD